MRNHPSSKQSGAALVEFGLMVTILFLLLAGTYEFGRAFAYYDALSKATRDGARFMSVAKKTNISSGFARSNVVITCLDASYNDSACVDGTAPGGVRVEISGYAVNIGQTVPLIGNSVRMINLTPRTTMRYML
jgi:Flp pilus assembly protein TadG